MKLLYIANARMPTEKAHGYQIIKMCEAFVLEGVSVKLVHAFRIQTSKELRKSSVFDYYQIPTIFDVVSLLNFDLIFLRNFIRKNNLDFMFYVNYLFWGLIATLYSLIQRADIHYTRNLEVAFWLSLFGLPIVLEMHGVPNRAGKKIIKYVSKSDHLKLMVPITSYIQDELIALGVPEEKIIVLPDAVDLSLFQNWPDKEEIRKKLGLGLELNIIGYIGRFKTMDMEKGIPELIQAFKYLEEESFYNSLALVCVGGPMEAVDQYQQLIRHLNLDPEKFIFVDRVPNVEVPGWMKACDVVTIPWQWNKFSAYYTSPMKMFEYMASEVPIVASDLPALRDVLEHEKNGLLVPAGDVKELANGIAKIFLNSDFSKTISQNARLDVQEYTWLKRAERIIDIVSN